MKKIFTNLACLSAMMIIFSACNDFMKKTKKVIEDENQDFSGYRIDSSKVSYNGQSIFMHGRVVDSVLIVEGDMVFNYATNPNLKAVADTMRLWPVVNNFITIPFVISTYPYSKRVTDAMDMWSKVLNIKFVAKTSSDKGYIDFVSSNKTSSEVGYSGSRQEIKISSGREPGNIAHEIGHALGLFHEQSRCDRDTFIVVKKLCNGMKAYKQAHLKRNNVDDIGDYNFHSIMHYRAGKCMQPKNPIYIDIMGQRDSISKGDYTAIQEIYKLH